MIFLSSFVALLGSISANGYQLGVNGNQAKIINDVQISNIQVPAMIL